MDKLRLLFQKSGLLFQIDNKQSSLLLFFWLYHELNIQNGDIKEEFGTLKIWGTTKSPNEKNLLWDKIKEIGRENPSDIIADIKVADESVYHRHTVSSGETLGKTAKQYYGNALKYKEVFAANSDILKNQYFIHPDQELILPNL